MLEIGSLFSKKCAQTNDGHELPRVRNRLFQKN